MRSTINTIREKGRHVALVPAVAIVTALPSIAHAEEVADAAAQTVQTTLLGKVSTWGGVGLVVIAAVVGFSIAFSMLKRGK